MLKEFDYEIVNKTEVPRKAIGSRGKWRQKLDLLNDNEAIKMLVKSKDEARRIGGSIRQTIAYSKPSYKTHYRSVPDGDGYSLYVWKERVI